MLNMHPFIESENKIIVYGGAAYQFGLNASFRMVKYEILRGTVQFGSIPESFRQFGG